MKPSDDVLRAWKRLDAAETASLRAADRRAALPAGSSRARVTTANAKWGSAAEERDRARDAYAMAIAAEARRMGIYQ